MTKILYIIWPRYILYFLFSFILISCTVFKESSQISTQKLIKIEINQGKKIYQTDDLVFNIINTSKQTLTIQKPERLFIEKYLDENWKKLRILPCPCDAPCQAPKSDQILQPNTGMNMNWNQNESWCGDRKSGEQIRETIYQKSGKGKFRFRLDFKDENGGMYTIYAYFKII